MQLSREDRGLMAFAAFILAAFAVVFAIQIHLAALHASEPQPTFAEAQAATAAYREAHPGEF